MKKKLEKESQMLQSDAYHQSVVELLKSHEDVSQFSRKMIMHSATKGDHHLHAFIDSMLYQIDPKKYKIPQRLLSVFGECLSQRFLTLESYFGFATSVSTKNKVLKESISSNHALHLQLGSRCIVSSLMPNTSGLVWIILAT